MIDQIELDESPTDKEKQLIHLYVAFHVFIEHIESEMKRLRMQPVKPRAELLRLRKVIREVQKDLAMLRKVLRESNIKMFKVGINCYSRKVYVRYMCGGVEYWDELSSDYKEWPIEEVEKRYYLTK
jgi:hypothetical protein